ncbi:hypothetical protein A2229_05560 [Candidatus Peregrinibacteria bacterium RIFOXYA2_FULL_33_7]|nr:MAG: hypothetical protein A2229_05560 [Candidatus Peregrinibacteria bacterium RIFOXYA2_FULL_33_7]
MMENLNFVIVFLSVLVFGLYGWKKGREEMFVALSFLFPAYLIKVNLGISFSLLEILVYETAIFRIVELIGKKKFKDDDFLKTYKEKWMILVYFFFLTGILGLVISILKYGFDWQYINFSKSFVLMPFLYVMSLFSFKPISQEFLKKLMDSMLISGIVIAIAVLLQKFIWNAEIVSLYKISIYLTPITIYCLLIIERNEEKSSLLQRFWSNISKFIRISFMHKRIYFYWLTLSVLVSALFFMCIYTNWMAIFLGFFFYIIFKDGKLNLEKIIAIFAGIVLFMGIFSTQFQNVNPKMGLKNNLFLPIRMEVWQNSVNMIKDNFLLGAGFDNWNLFYEKYLNNKQAYYYPLLSTHNYFSTFIEVLLNFGLFGLIFLIGIVFVSFKKVFSSINQAKLQLVLGSMLLSVVFIFFFYSGYFQEDLVLQFWLIVGGILGVRNE